MRKSALTSEAFSNRNSALPSQGPMHCAVGGGLTSDNGAYKGKDHPGSLPEHLILYFRMKPTIRRLFALSSAALIQSKKVYV
jgi:hypothetical protein